MSTQRITEYLWDGANIVQHSQKTADGSVIQEIEYLYEPETFRPLAQVTHKANQASQLHYIVTDHAGTPQELCSEDAMSFGKVNKPCGAITNRKMRYQIMILEKTPTMMSSTVTCVTKGK
ncbi:hypothetical protein [Vibrio vulnificus]|uniref:hypothetical protein n=1 Tax=Vibrio vulnificus TaxID=672 RepID=UPI0024DFC476|nr:hypothetical protein [Vibrio vulnificus]MDK2620464.1 hypothetical protein [Vibrio vulnificus]